jgi:CheY-like chemotaxis protein/signal transduction histidine kinase
MQDDDGALVAELRRALNHLYDPAELRASPLLERFGFAAQRDAGAALRRTLTDAICALKPDRSTPAGANAWRIHRLLSQRFIEQSPQSEVARDLGLGIRQYRRLEAQALGVLADGLRARYGLLPVALPGGGRALHAAASDPPPGDAGAGDEGGDSSRAAELAWLQESLPSEPVDVKTALLAALRLVGPLAQAQHVALETHAPDGLPLGVGQATALRQALLTALAAAVRSALAGQVEVRAEAEGWEVGCHIRPVSLQAQREPVLAEDADSLQMARQLIEVTGGVCRLQISQEGPSPFSIWLSLPILESVPVLAIDDNLDTLQLLQRYTVGTRYRLTGLRDPAQALEVATELNPQIIVLDVMLPHIDGWDLLGRLLQHPATRHIPVLMCTILPHEQLALSMGAAGFIRKPVSRQAFLQALDCHLLPPQD